MSEQKEPWYDRAMTKNEIAAMGVFVTLVFGILIYNIHRVESNMESRHDAEKAACQALDIKFGQSVRVKEGFYKDVEFTAVGKGEETVEVQYLKGLQLENARFRCSDIVAK